MVDCNNATPIHWAWDMKMWKLISLVLLVLFFSTACSKNDHPTYTISRKGVLLTQENFDVIHVYGFSDNREIARQLTEYLNETEPNTYFYFQVEQ